MDQEITKEELEQLELLAFQDPILKKEYDKHRLTIQGIKSKCTSGGIKGYYGYRKKDNSDGI